MIAPEVKTNANTYNVRPESGTTLSWVSYEEQHEYPRPVISSRRTQHRIAVEQRIDELNRLEDGWLDGEGQALSEDGLYWLRDQLLDNYPSTAPVIRLYPTPSGDVQAEWLIDDHDISLEVDLKDHAGIWFDYDLRSKRVHEHRIDLDNVQSWKWITERLSTVNAR